ncbi:tRNA threonylcarbamoyl adenosine modification protein YeaZ [Stackebrandtia albiflava]|uniref:tRNA threonylcarbamoyl adenosine modification protein YeaZ n=1 Tax=Stackebrandtia albiflava TaxID=406432 RepID=A0A562UYC1_9ACTN|nr:tRNA (adenosine(37)-N6)-threonylcarbamoyltransferase complex dimerization subunit type 1 TsaB [Stackebrandtia albiflava]TWJ10619.1 tRNA threonylcarbamoyl adenosine modification protein YeaZ [Stackebrandtia albiflava]
MLTLVIDTSTPAVTAGVYEVSGPGAVERLADGAVVDARGHGEHLAPLIDGALAEARVAPRDLAAVVAGLGPGPFTGLRVGLVTAASMSHALGVPAYGVCSLDAVGFAAAGGGGPVLVATDARRKEIYWGLYDSDGERLAGPEVARPAELPEAARAATRVVGDGALLYPEVFPDAKDEWRYPPPQVLAFLASGRIAAKAPGEVLTPLYLRRPDVHVAGRQQRMT